MHTSDDLSSKHGNRGHGKTGSGHGSFGMQDPDLIFHAIKLKNGDTFLDMGCGPGDYAIHASRIVADSGVVYAVDKWRDVIETLNTRADSLALKNVRAMVFDVMQPLPIDDQCVDVCFLATVLHTLDLTTDKSSLPTEIRRFLRPGGCLAILNCKKEDQPFGPPVHIRWSPEEVEDWLRPHGFEKVGYVDLGLNYLIHFVVK